MSDFDELAKESGIDMSDDSLKVTNTGTGGAYSYPEGEYSVLVGNFHLKYKDADGKTCESDKAGAEVAFGMQDFLIIKDPNKMLVDNKYNLVPGEDVRAYMYKQYVTLKTDDQWQNKKIYASMFIENVPQFDVIENKDSKDFVVRLGLVKMYLGSPAKMILKKSKNDRLYLESVELNSHEIDKEKLAKRKEVASAMYKQIDAKWNEYHAQKNANKGDDGVVQDVQDADDLLDGFE